ncbi:MAG: hypothetical protein VKP62_16965 [Candidatus Sericytochromatia bacterium]|nr:hypothetical protein [Candidatus Sericytochromatia bacterium]
MLEAGLRQGQQALDGVVKTQVQLATTVTSAAGDAFQSIVLPVLDGSPVGGRVHTDKGMGPLGPVLTERLAVGEAVSVEVEAGVTLPTEFTGAPNVKLDRGATLTVRRVEALYEQNRPILDPATGKPETRLEVKLTNVSRDGAAYSAEVGVNAGVTWGQHRVGLTAEAKAEAELGANQTVTLTTRLDPNDPSSGATLSHVLNSVAKASGLNTVPGLTEALQQATGGPPSPATNTIFESISQDIGLYTAASAEASLEAGLRQAEKGSTGLIQNADAFEKNGLEGLLKLTLAAASASAGSEVGVGQELNGRTGERTMKIRVAAEAGASATLLNQGANGQVRGERTISLVSKEGVVTGANVTMTVSREQFAALRNTVEDVYGRPLDEGFIAGLSSEDTVRMTLSVRPEVLAKMKTGDPAALQQAVTALVSGGLNRSDFSLQEGNIQRVRRNEFQLSGDMGLALLGKLESRGGITFGHEQMVEG